MTTKHNYEAAEKLLTEFLLTTSSKKELEAMPEYRAVLHALRVAKALQDGPSEEMEDAAVKALSDLDEFGEPKPYGPTSVYVFTAMRDQLYREVE